MKVHLRDHTTSADDYKQSPHIFGSINEGTWAVCQHIAFDDKITDNLAEVECKECIRLHQVKVQFGLVPKLAIEREREASIERMFK